MTSACGPWPSCCSLRATKGFVMTWSSMTMLRAASGTGFASWTVMTFSASEGGRLSKVTSAWVSTSGVLASWGLSRRTRASPTAFFSSSMTRFPESAWEALPTVTMWESTATASDAARASTVLRDGLSSIIGARCAAVGQTETARAQTTSARTVVRVSARRMPTLLQTEVPPLVVGPSALDASAESKASTSSSCASCGAFAAAGTLPVYIMVILASRLACSKTDRCDWSAAECKR
mmetsp:Transcript_8935/g.26482  ORF Transcript_8935/g.26482 Transcript_8935/m.26482 type:complete len:235 (+) Transcript_8935:119-823(+)